MDITLEQLLRSRDARQETQRKLLQKYKGKTLLCLTVIMPGKEKRNTNSLIVARVAMQTIESNFEQQIIYKEEKDLQTGFEVYYIIDKEAISLKKELCKIEQEHLLGRLFDMDVINSEGIPISRKDIGFEPRKCLICEKESRFCMRNFTHSQEELQRKIDQQIKAYLSLEKK
ncbi:MAG: citrate lyase holo-[acyl-carrier protein] synthase [Bacteroidota bacterium]|nr:citrate lyase holo-[acyl-carrier protein] synthase [Bacteroidota bacterium]